MFWLWYSYGMGKRLNESNKELGGMMQCRKHWPSCFPDVLMHVHADMRLLETIEQSPAMAYMESPKDAHPTTATCIESTDQRAQVGHLVSEDHTWLLHPWASEGPSVSCLLCTGFTGLDHYVPYTAPASQSTSTTPSKESVQSIVNERLSQSITFEWMLGEIFKLHISIIAHLWHQF